LDALEIEVWHYEPGTMFKSNVDLKKKYKQMNSYNKNCPLNYFSHNLIFKECGAKSVSNLMDEYLDADQY